MASASLRSSASILSVLVVLSFSGGSGTVSGDSSPIKPMAEPGGKVFVGTIPGPMNTNGSLFWTGEEWRTDIVASHLYFVTTPGGNRLKEENTVLNVTGDSMGSSFNIDNVSMKIKNLKRTEVVSTGRISYSCNEFDITLGGHGPTGWKLLLISRTDGRYAGDSYFHVYLQEGENRTIYFMEGIKAKATNLPISRVVGSDIARADQTFLLPDAPSQYWLDVNGGSDMGGLTFKLVTGTLDLSAVGKGNGTTVIRSLEIKYLNSTGSLNRVVIHPRVENLARPSGGAAPRGIPASAPVLLLSAFILTVLLANQKRHLAR